ncbi:MAG: hypothetical protein IJY36_03290 [Coprobacter sp.]|nr:hypothetical protein [Coprobacter sp.]
MNKRLLIVTFFAFLLSALHADNVMDYEIVAAGSGTQGNYLVNVYVYSKKAKLSPEELKKCAVHGVLFKGFTSKENRVSQKPLAGNALTEQQHSDFFNLFFGDNGTYKNYVSMTSSAYEVIKVQKKTYRIGATLSVAKEQLRKDLEAAGIIKKLSTGF